MSRDLIRAHLNLYAVLQNLEELVRLDDETANLVRTWDLCIQFSVRNGPAAYLDFKNGSCKHGRGVHPKPTIKLYFTSPSHLNGMFDGTATPIPLKGFTRLGFLKSGFTRLTDRLAHYLKPENGQLTDDRTRRINTILTLYTAFHAAGELAVLDPLCRGMAAHLPRGALQAEVLPEGPYVHILFSEDGVTVSKSRIEKPMARMIFKDLDVVRRLLAGELDTFLAVPDGDITLQGQLPLIDTGGLILDKVGAYLA